MAINTAMLMRQPHRLFSAPAVTPAKKVRRYICDYQYALGTAPPPRRVAAHGASRPSRPHLPRRPLHVRGHALQSVFESFPPWPAVFTTADIAPCGMLRGSSALRLFDVPCVKRIPGVISAVESAKEGASTGDSSPKTDAFCVDQSFSISSKPDMKAPVAGRLFVDGYSKSSVRFLGLVTQPGGLDVHGERIVAVCRRTFVRVETHAGRTTSAPYTEEERAVLEADVATTDRFIERFAASWPEGLGVDPIQLTDPLSNGADGADAASVPREMLEAMFTQRVLPHHVRRFSRRRSPLHYLYRWHRDLHTAAD